LLSNSKSQYPEISTSLLFGTLGNVSFYQWHFYFFTGIDEPAVSVSFVGKPNNGMAEMLTADPLKGERKTQHRKAYERLAGLRPSALKAYLI